jgi:hypothetical protein
MINKINENVNSDKIDKYLDGSFEYSPKNNNKKIQD